MPIYLVIYYELYVGYYVDEDTRYFSDLDAAISYTNKLNLEIAKANNCSVADLDDYYEIKAIKKGE